VLHAAPPAAGRPLSGVRIQTPEETAAAIVELIDRPQAECYTDPAQAEAAARCCADVEAFERNLSR
jgi:hypothetical protein